jgi:hypothetical protein
VKTGGNVSLLEKRDPQQLQAYQAAGRRPGAFRPCEVDSKGKQVLAMPQWTIRNPLLRHPWISARSRKLRSRKWVWEFPELTTLVASPFIFGMAIPLLVFDAFATLYQYIAFPVLGIPLVNRREYMRLDRHRLDYLNPIQKMGCTYCGYANGLLNYATQIAARTERVFCPIKHDAGGVFHPPAHHQEFAEFGDAAGFRFRWKKREMRKREPR